MIIFYIFSILFITASLVLIKFYEDMFLDWQELSDTTVIQKYAVFINELNGAFFSGSGTIRSSKYDRKELFISRNENEHFRLYYNAGSLHVTYHFKFFCSITENEFCFAKIRNSPQRLQYDMAKHMVNLAKTWNIETVEKFGR